MVGRLGLEDGEAVGGLVITGEAVGFTEGWAVGPMVGSTDGLEEGNRVGVRDGAAEGEELGEVLGAPVVGLVGEVLEEGCFVDGLVVGAFWVGLALGNEGLVEGVGVGLADGLVLGGEEGRGEGS